MKKLIIAACCVAFVGGATAASAQMSNGPMENSMSKPMDSNARMMKKKKMMKKHGRMQSCRSKDGMGMSGDGMKKM